MGRPKVLIRRSEQAEEELVEESVLEGDHLLDADELRDLVVALGLDIVAVKTQLLQLRLDMESINPNIYPVKVSTKVSWQEAVKRLERLLQSSTDKIPQLFKVNEAVGE